MLSRITMTIRRRPASLFFSRSSSHQSLRLSLMIVVAAAMMVAAAANNHRHGVKAHSRRNHQHRTSVFLTIGPIKAAAAALSSQIQPSPKPRLYQLGSFAYVNGPEQGTSVSLMYSRLRNLVARSKAFLVDNKVLGGFVRTIRLWMFWALTKDTFISILEDKWEAERDPDKFFGRNSTAGNLWVNDGHREVVRERMKRSKRNRNWVGVGYTPRLVWLTSVLLRGTLRCTSLRKVFEPTLSGWGAGTALASQVTHQEWISSFLIGWFGSEYYWSIIFGVNGPPNPSDVGYGGIPIFIQHVRDVRLL